MLFRFADWRLESRDDAPVKLVIYGVCCCILKKRSSERLAIAIMSAKIASVVKIIAFIKLLVAVAPSLIQIIRIKPFA